MAVRKTDLSNGKSIFFTSEPVAGLNFDLSGIQLIVDDSIFQHVPEPARSNAKNTPWEE